MSRSARSPFQTIRSEGGLLPADLLQRVAQGDKHLGGLRDEDYHASDLPLNERIVRSWNRLVGAWASFKDARAALPADDPGTTVTRERWLLVLFEELGYGRLQTARAAEIEGRSYPVSHVWASVPIHLVGCNISLEKPTPGVAGAARHSPHGLLQELLNRSEDRLWGFTSNGLLLRVLRDNSALTRQAYVEFDLEQMLDSEAYADFALLWLTCHQSRLEGERPHECWLERWSQEAQKQGTRALESMRDGVERAISSLGAGFLAHPANGELRNALRSGELSKEDYYRELLRLVYRLLFLFVAEDRDLLLLPDASSEARERFERWYSTRRLRELAGRRRGTKHGDQYEALKLVMARLGDDDGCPELGLPALGSFIWSEQAIAHLAPATLANADLLEAVRALATVRDGRVLRVVDYRNLGAEELGSVYESLLELHPDLNADAGTFALATAAGHERKTTGSYYTPSSLISVLLDSALDPVLDEAATEGEEAILALKVCDPACGSGHFLVAAAHRIAKRLASVRTGDEEPSPEATRVALRDVVSRCLYGVDVNPMAVELCKVSLWMEALDPGRPLSFLDAHIKCGNSLLGTTAALMVDGVPDDAFKPLEGDDKEVAKALRKQNKQEREGQLSFEDESSDLASELQSQIEKLERADDTTTEAVHTKEQLFRGLLCSEAYARAKLAADSWCAAFVQGMRSGAPRVTTGVIRRVAGGKGAIPAELVEEVRRLAADFAFFHWEVEYPGVFVGESGGFDVVLGNPPWETVQLTEKEFFADHPEIAEARNASVRKRLIQGLEESDPPLFRRYRAALRSTEATNLFARASQRYPLAARGKINTYALFAELMNSIVARSGCTGAIVPLGIATDDTTRHLFSALVDQRSLLSLYGFENEDFIFPSVHHAMKFCLLTTTGSLRPADTSTFAFFCRRVEDLREPARLFELTREDLTLMNPNTRTSPVFRTSRDADLTKGIYRRYSVFMEHSQGDDGNPWAASYRQGLFNTASDSNLFRSEEDLLSARDSQTERWLPLYEAKMLHQFDHRFGTYVGQTDAQARQGKLPEMTDEQHVDPSSEATPQYWVSSTAVDERLQGRWSASWLLGFRKTCRSVDERTMIASVLPRVGVADTFPLLFPERGPVLALLGNLNAFVFDFVARNKFSGTNMLMFIVEQLPVMRPDHFEGRALWDSSRTLESWIGDRVIELAHTANDMAPLAVDSGYAELPYRWDVERRAMLRAEVDAAFFHLYGLERDDVDYVMDTFWVVRDRDVKAHGEYRTKRLILEIYDELAEASATGQPYQTRLDPPPADPSAAHSPLAVSRTSE